MDDSEVRQKHKENIAAGVYYGDNSTNYEYVDDRTTTYSVPSAPVYDMADNYPTSRSNSNQGPTSQPFCQTTQEVGYIDVASFDA